MKVAIINDVHIGTHDDSPIFHDHIQKFFETEFFPRIIKDEIKTIVCLGDLFDKRKTINMYTLSRAKEYFFNVVKDLGIKLIVLIGNHDAFYKSTNEINTPEQLLKDYDNIFIYSSPTKVGISGKEVDVIPWINKKNYQETLDFISSSSNVICFAHLELSGFVFQQGIVAKTGLSPDIFNRYQTVLTGHYHSKSSKGNVHYLGAHYDLTWADYGEKKYWHIFDMNTLQLEAIENKNRLFVKLYYSDDAPDFEQELKNADFSDLTNCIISVIIKERQSAVLFDMFMTKVNESNPYDVVIVDEELYSTADNSNIDILVSDTHAILKSSIEAVSVNVDKDKLFMLMNDLYKEASTI